MKNKSTKNKFIVAVITVVLLIAAAFYILPQINSGAESNTHTVAPVPQGLINDR